MSQRVSIDKREALTKKQAEVVAYLLRMTIDTDSWREPQDRRLDAKQLQSAREALAKIERSINKSI